MSTESTLHAITTQLALAVQPLRRAFESLDNFKSFMRTLGWNGDTNTTVPYLNLVTRVNQVLTSYNTLNANPTPSVNDVLTLLEEVKLLYGDIKGITTAPAGVPAGADTTTFLNELPKRTFEMLLINYVNSVLPKLFNGLRTAGVFENQYTAEAPPRTEYGRIVFRKDRLQQLINNPIELFKNIYAWNSPDFSFDSLLSYLHRFCVSYGIPSSIEPVPVDLGMGFGIDNGTFNGKRYLNIPLFEFYVSSQVHKISLGIIPYTSSINTTLPGIIIQPIIPTSVGTAIQLTDDFLLELRAGTNLGSLLGVKITPQGLDIIYPFQPGGTLPTAGFGTTLKYAPQTPIVLLGNPTGSRLEMQGADIGLFVDHFDNSFEVQLDAALKGFALVLKGGDGDGFISKLLGNAEKRIEPEFGINWSNTGGLRFRGAGGFELQLNPHIQLGPISVENLRLALQAPPTTPAKAKLMAAAGLKLKLGPFTATIQEIGVELALIFADGNAGPFDIKAGFKPPTGLGMKIDNGDLLSGGGFLSFNKDEGRYIGVLDLKIKQKITLKAIGILTTKLPGGAQGYSLLLMVTVEGFKPLPLGFGFTLNGVGGLMALNRRMNTQALRDGVRNGTIDNILFPKDPVNNINSIVSSLESVFPIAEGRYSFGPMAIIAWGSPTLITAEVGIFFELPNPQELAIIGVIRAVLPDDTKKLLKLQIAFAGIIDFNKKYITFDASLFDSTYVGLPLSGDMAFRLRWGDQPTFVLTVGGFHPKFTIPQLNLPELRRLTINLNPTNKLRLTFSSYFAVTSNTAQFGSQVDFLWQATSDLKLSGYLGFDALFYFSPFRFMANMQGGLDVIYKSKAVLSITFAGQLEGPTPWHLQGSVTFKLLGVNKSIDFDTTFGKPEVTTLPDIQVLPLLTAALQDKKNWQSTMATDVPLMVTLREAATNPNDVVVHPQGTIAVSQKVVPLDLTIARYGNRRPDPAGNTRFSLGINYSSTITATNPLLAKTELREYFAPNEYFDLSEDEKLARESFERMPSGLQVANTSTALSSGAYHEVQQDYEVIYMDSRTQPIRMAIKDNISIQARTAFGGNGSAANSPMGSLAQGRSAFAPVNVAVANTDFVIAQTYNGAQYQGKGAASKTEALALMHELIESDPSLEGKLNVIHKFEL